VLQVQVRAVYIESNRIPLHGFSRNPGPEAVDIAYRQTGTCKKSMGRHSVGRRQANKARQRIVLMTY